MQSRWSRNNVRRYTTHITRMQILSKWRRNALEYKYIRTNYFYFLITASLEIEYIKQNTGWPAHPTDTGNFHFDSRSHFNGPSALLEIVIGAIDIGCGRLGRATEMGSWIPGVGGHMCWSPLSCTLWSGRSSAWRWPPWTLPVRSCPAWRRWAGTRGSGPGTSG